ncbi:MAG TPA: 5'/3'-nucleotidase SurE [Caldilineae bacterium]|nr:5'/3'-nucleotidase SurE [Caldilineae bacterium]
MRPFILVTNDDGIHSPGLHAAIEALADLGELLIIAPTRQQTGMSRSLPPTFDGRILPIKLVHNGHIYHAFHMDGSPAQCVLYGALDCAQRTPDLVVSGINYGENLGNSTMVSGTVGAALQGGDMGIPSLAVSLETKKEYHYNHGLDVNWETASHWLRFFAQRALTTKPWPEDVAALKIDIPAPATPETPWRITRQSRQPYYISLPTRRHRAEEPRVMDYDVRVEVGKLEPDSDIYAFAVDRVISVTPLSVNLTARVPLPMFEQQLREGAAKSPRAETPTRRHADTP